MMETTIYLINEGKLGWKASGKIVQKTKGKKTARTNPHGSSFVSFLKTPLLLKCKCSLL
jgi:hypothetical protein